MQALYGGTTDSLGTHRQGSVIGAWLSEEDDMPWVAGSASSNESTPELTDNEAAREKRLRREALRRRRPIGFVSWEEE